MAYLTETQLEKLIVLPLSLPLTRLEPDSSLVLGVVELDSPSQRLQVPYLQLKVFSKTGANDNRKDAARGYVYASILRNGTALEHVHVNPANFTPPVLAKLAGAWLFDGPSAGSKYEYTCVVTNNCANAAVTVAVSGVWKVDLCKLLDAAL